MHPRSQLYILTRLWIELTREMSRIHAPHVEERFGSGAADTLLCAAVHLGMAEDREMTASKLADFVGLPRPTVLRRLDALAPAWSSAATKATARPQRRRSL